MITVQLTEREAKILRGWLQALTFQGTAQELTAPLAVQAELCKKLETALANQAPNERASLVASH